MPKSVAVDTNLLVLLVVGLTSREFIALHKRCNYDADGFDLLFEKLTEFEEIVLTPNTLTEASNLLRQIPEPYRSQISLAFRHFIQQHSERYIASNRASSGGYFVRQGLCDSVLLQLLDHDQTALLSADNDLYLAALREGFDALNFAHLYEARFG